MSVNNTNEENYEELQKRLNEVIESENDKKKKIKRLGIKKW